MGMALGRRCPGGAGNRPPRMAHAASRSRRGSAAGFALWRAHDGTRLCPFITERGPGCVTNVAAHAYAALRARWGLPLRVFEH